LPVPWLTLELPSAALPQVVLAASRFAGAVFVGAVFVALSVGGLRLGAGCVGLLVRRASAGAAAMPSFDAGAKPGPWLGTFDACATLSDDAAGGVLEAHAAATIELTNKIPSCLIVVLFCLPQWGLSARPADFVLGEALCSSAISRPSTSAR
jgi:hypothetical protein